MKKTRPVVRSWLIALAAAAALALPAPASSADGDPEAIAEATQLLRVTNAGASADQVMSMMLVQIGDLVKKLNPGQGALVEQLMREHFLPEFKASYGEMERMFAEVYARHFTAEEMRQLRAFYETPLGQKTISEMPALLAEGAQLGQKWGTEVARRAFEKLKPALQEHGLQSPNI